MKNLTLSAAKIAEIVKGKVVGDAERIITGVSGIREAKASDLSFVGSKRYEKQLSETAAGIILVCADLANAGTEERTLIVCDNVDYAFSVVVAMFAEEPPGVAGRNSSQCGCLSQGCYRSGCLHQRQCRC